MVQEYHNNMTPVEFKINEAIGLVLQKYAQDLKKNRKGNRFIFPEFPKSDTSLPQVVVTLNEPSYQNDSAGDILYSKKLENGDHEEYFYKRADYNVVLYTMTVKDKEYETSMNGDKVYLSNKMAADFWSSHIIEVLRQHRNELLLEFDDFQVERKVPSYEANKTRWTCEIHCVVQIKDIWVKRFHAGELIREYTLNTNTMEDE